MFEVHIFSCNKVNILGFLCLLFNSCFRYLGNHYDEYKQSSPTLKLVFYVLFFEIKTYFYVNLVFSQFKKRISQFHQVNEQCFCHSILPHDLSHFSEPSQGYLGLFQLLAKALPWISHLWCHLVSSSHPNLTFTQSVWGWLKFLITNLFSYCLLNLSWYLTHTTVILIREWQLFLISL